MKSDYEMVLENVAILQRLNKGDDIISSLCIITQLLCELETRRFLNVSYHKTFRHDQITIDVWFNKGK